jgi:dTDP-glucose 4,6-dehydratase
MSLVSKVDGVINLAAESHVDRSIDNPEVFLASNIIGASNIFAACEVFKKRILQVSTDEVYGSIVSGFADESHQLDPSSPYSSSKASADLIGLAFHKTYGLDIVITRCGNNYGCNQYPEKLIPLFIKNLSTGKNVPLYGDGTNSRDWVHVEDHCNGIALAFLNGKSGNVYNIGNVDHLSNLQVTQEILDAMGLGWDRVETVKDRPGHDWRYAISSNKIKRELNWVPKKNFRAELPSLINFYSL